MRELARFLIIVQKHDSNIKSLSDVLDPVKFPVAIKSTKLLCSYAEDTNKYGNPSLVLKIGHLLKKCAKIKKSSALSSGDSVMGRKADEFLSLCIDDWTDEISSSALQTLETNKINKK